MQGNKTTLATCLAAVGLLGISIDQAKALGCGDTLLADTTLTSDLNCRGFPFALKLARNGIALNLGGRVITAGTEGVVAEGVTAVRVMGPGRIQGGQRAIRAQRTNLFKVSGIEVVSGGPDGIVLIDSSNASIESNTFNGLNGKGVDVIQQPGSGGVPSGGHTITGNTFANAGFGIRFCGADAGNNLVLSNNFINMGTAALVTTQGAASNRVHSNAFASLTLVKLESNDNIVSGNRFATGSRGLAIAGNPGATCFRRDPGVIVKDNHVQNNTFNGVATALLVGNGAPGTRAEHNQLNGNNINGATVGLRFAVDGAFNNGSANVFTATTTPVVDLGVGNVW